MPGQRCFPNRYCLSIAGLLVTGRVCSMPVKPPSSARGLAAGAGFHPVAAMLCLAQCHLQTCRSAHRRTSPAVEQGGLLLQAQMAQTILPPA